MTHVKISQDHDPLCERGLGMTKAPTPGCPRCDAVVARLEGLKRVATTRAKEGPPIVSRDLKKAQFYREAAFRPDSEWTPADEYEDDGLRFDSEGAPVVFNRQTVVSVRRSYRRFMRRVRVVSCVVAVLGAGFYSYARQGNDGCPSGTSQDANGMTTTCDRPSGQVVCQQGTGTLGVYAWPNCQSEGRRH